jgi:hypothetical protein
VAGFMNNNQQQHAASHLIFVPSWCISFHVFCGLPMFILTTGGYWCTNLEVSVQSVLNSFSSLYNVIKPECASQGLDTVIVYTLVITDRLQIAAVSIKLLLTKSCLGTSMTEYNAEPCPRYLLRYSRIIVLTVNKKQCYNICHIRLLS